MNKDILFLIAKRLSLHDLLKFTQLNKKTYIRKEIWLHKLITEFPNWKDFKFDKTCKETYTTLYQLENLKEKLNYEIIDPYNEDLKFSLLDLYNEKDINLSYNLMIEIPKEICQLYNLQILDLCNNQISKIPKEIGQLYNLQSLDLSNNQIRKIPKEIGQLCNLHTLWLNKNQIRKIPKELSELKKLENLNLSYNRIYEIPKEIKVKRLYLFGNPLRKFYVSQIILILFIFVILYALPHFIGL